MLNSAEKQLIKDGVPASSQSEMDFALDALHANRNRWIETSVDERLVLLDELLDSLRGVAERWVAYGHAAKRIDRNHPGSGDDWAFAAIPFRQVHMLKQSLTDIKHYGRPRPPARFTTRDDGRVVAPVFPNSRKDKFLYNGLKGEVWFRPGVKIPDIVQQQAKAYHDKEQVGRVALILAAGNVSSLIPGDFMYKLFVENQVVLVKMNPVNEYMGPLISAGYKPLIDRGLLRVVYGGVEESSYLINHDYVDELHVTGSDKTYDAIVFGTGEEGAQRKRDRQPIMTKRFTAELGNITPIIVVPGPWTDADIDYQANSIAAQLAVNAGFNCLTPRVIVQHATWEHRDALNDRINAVMADVPTRYAYYPNAKQRHAAFLSAHPNAKLHGDTSGDKLPWTYIQDVDPTRTDDIAFSTEAFCSITTETALEAANPAAFVDKAVAFVNEQLWGTLTATIIVHPQSLKDPAVAEAVERAVADLRYGSVCVNLSGAIAYATLATSWGGHSGAEPHDIQSGIGVVNNMLMFDEDQIQKSVTRAPFRTPISNQDMRNVRFARLSEGMMWFEAEPSVATTFALLRTMIIGK